MTTWIATTTGPPVGVRVVDVDGDEPPRKLALGCQGAALVIRDLVGSAPVAVDSTAAGAALAQTLRSFGVKVVTFSLAQAMS